MRKVMLNLAVLSAVAGIVPAIRQTAKGPRDWRLALLWVGWGIDVAIAVGTVIERNRLEQEAKDREALGLPPLPEPR